METLLDYLVKHNFWFLSTQELYDYFITHAKKIPPEHLGQKPVMLSFDDGYKNIYTNLLPILEKLEYKYGRKVKVVVFANPGTLANYESNSSYHMTCKDLREGLEKGFYDIQSHGLNHKNLTKINTHDLINEVLNAQVELRKCTTDLDPNKLVAAHIAYPYGATNEQVQKYASKYYLSSYLYNSKIMKIGWLSDQYHIPRLTVNWQKPASKLIQMAARSSELVKKAS
jgi:peptidoglycan/xylan/chitin deacetylase (PgdA/CDA1 family)